MEYKPGFQGAGAAYLFDAATGVEQHELTSTASADASVRWARANGTGAAFAAEIRAGVGVDAVRRVKSPASAAEGVGSDVGKGRRGKRTSGLAAFSVAAALRASWTPTP